MARHLQACAKRQVHIQRAEAVADRVDTILHLQVEDATSGQYWLHLEMRGSASLRTLDTYLRAIWLECCGHMSKFVEGHRWGGSDISASRKAAQALSPGSEVTHVYDFGTTSYTKVRVLHTRAGSLPGKHPIRLMARNQPPAAQCMRCGEPANMLCMECVYEYELAGGLCEHHAPDHQHEEYGELVPLVNSPRVGMCGYVGPAEPPY